MTDGRARARALLRGEPATLAAPSALRPAARIQERDWDTFLRDATQLANGLRDLADAVPASGLVVTTPDVVTADPGEPMARPTVTTALEATRRLHASLGDRMALVACLPGPAGLPGEDADVLALGKAFLAAGIDVLVVLEGHGRAGSTVALGNIARFHQALALGCCDEQGLGATVVRATTDDLSAGHRDGVVLSEDLPADTDIAALIDWVHAIEDP